MRSMTVRLSNSAAANRFRRVLRGRSEAERFRAQVDEGLVEVGEGTYGSPWCRIWEPPTAGQPPHVVIGKYCSIAYEVTMLVNGDHRTNWTSTFPFAYEYGLDRPGSKDHLRPTGPITIGNDVWIGHGATIMGGSTIGDGAVIGAMAVVRGDVRPYAVVTGNPANEVRRRFDDDTIERLLGMQWWDLPVGRGTRPRPAALWPTRPRPAGVGDSRPSSGR